MTRRSIVFSSIGAAIAVLIAFRLVTTHSSDPAQIGFRALEDGRTQDAITSLRDAVRASPNDSSSHYNLGIALERAGWMEQAISEYETAQRLDPSNATYRTGLAQTKRTLGYRAQVQGKHQEAVGLFQSVLTLTPDDALTWYNLSVSYTKLDKSIEANQARMKAASLDSKYRPKPGL